MRTIGIDPSSTRTGLAMMDGETLVYSDNFVRDRSQPMEREMLRLHNLLGTMIKRHKPERVGIERVQVQQNLDTVRKIAYFEAACMTAAARARVPVVQLTVTNARKLALGRNMKKPEAIAEVQSRYPGELTGDECDAIVIGIAAGLKEVT